MTTSPTSFPTDAGTLPGSDAMTMSGDGGMTEPVGDGAVDAGSDSGSPIGCGNSVVEAGEECDDGNDDQFDGCTNECTTWTEAAGTPIELNRPNQWQYVEVPGTRCNSGATAGFSVSANPDSDKLLIYLEGGGASFPGNCLNFDGAPNSTPGPAGIFDRNNARNPFRDWNLVYVPYCTADVFAGTRPDVTIDCPGLLGIPTPRTFQFVGYSNVTAFLERLVPTFREADQVVLTGISAGGFGAGANTIQTQEAFGPIPVTLIDDSGPALPNSVLDPCLQRSFVETWGADDGVLAACGEDCSDYDNWTEDLALHIAQRYPNSNGGLFSFTADGIIRGYFDPFCNPDRGAITPEAYETGLEEFRTEVRSVASNFGTFYATGSGHTCFAGSCFYDTTVDGVALTDWVSDLVDGQVSHVGP